MDAHPVPQNVTDFEFHLIGDMTIKQFGYLAAGVVTSWLIFMIFGRNAPFIVYPFILIPAGIGAAFAFLPIQDRPLDHWLSAFFRAISRPTKRTFQSKIIQKEDPLFKDRLQVFLNLHQKEKAAITLPRPISNALLKPQKTVFGVDINQKKPTVPQSGPSAAEIFLSQPEQPTPLTSNPIGVSAQSTAQPASIQPAPSTNTPPPVFQPLPALQVPPPPIDVSATPHQPIQTATPQTNPQIQIKVAPAPSEEDLKKTIELAKQTQLIQAQIVKTEQEINKIKQNASTPGIDPKQFIEQFESLLTQLQKLNQQASDISAKTPVATKVTPKIPSSAAIKHIPSATTLPPAPAAPLPAKSIPTLTLTTIPNVINGIVTDAAGGYLDGGIIVAHDKQGLPVRALKTNKLGQFIAATPLLNGTYTITVEKDNLLFDEVEVELKGNVLQPVVISAKRSDAAAAVGGALQ